MPPPPAGTIRTASRECVNPVDYQHPYGSLARFPKMLALRYDANRTRHAYYRHVTHQKIRDALRQMDALCRNLPRRRLWPAPPSWGHCERFRRIS